MHVKTAKFLWPLPLVDGPCALTGCTARAQVFRPVPLCWLIPDPARKKRVDLESVCGRAILHQVAPQERLPVEFFQVCPHGIWQNAFTPISFRICAHRTQGTCSRKEPLSQTTKAHIFRKFESPRAPLRRQPQSMRGKGASVARAVSSTGGHKRIWCTRLGRLTPWNV